MEKELTEKIAKGEVVVCNLEEVKKRVRRVEEEQEKTKQSSRAEESVEGLPYFMQVQERKQEKVLRQFEKQEESWKEVEDALSSKVGRSSDKQLFSVSAQNFRNKIENRNALHELQGKSETLNANDYWRSTLRSRIYSEQSGQRCLRTTQRQDEKEKKEYKQQLMQELHEITKEPGTLKQKRDQELTMRHIIKQLQDRKEKEEEKYVFILDDEYVCRLDNFYSVDHIEKTSKSKRSAKEKESVSLKAYIESATRVNPKWKFI